MNEFENMHMCPRCGVSRYKVKDDDFSSNNVITEGTSTIFTKKGTSAKVLWYISIFQGSSDCSLMQTMQRTLEGMQIRENVMVRFVIRLIICNGIKLIVSFWNSKISQETLGLDLLWMEWMCMITWVVFIVHDPLFWWFTTCLLCCA